MRFLGFALVGMLLAIGTAGAANLAQPWQMNLPEAVTPVMESVVSFHNFLLWIITAITLFVLVLLVYALVRFSAGANPEPSRTTHNTLVEVAWTVVPILILIAIAIPSFRLLYLQRDFPQADFTIKATGSQWFWSYEYPDHGDIFFDSLMKPVDELEPGEPRLLATTAPVVVPVNATVSLIVTANDVIHSWTVHSFGEKIDAIPGRLNQAWFRAEREGVFYGSCVELCGIGHSDMPIEVRVVSQAEFDEWVETTVAEGVGAANRMLTQRLRARGLLAAIDHEDSLAAPLAHAPAY
jgi:cytochrome c oxidase subunit II